MNTTLLRLRRAEIEARVEDLISLLDLLDGDPDIEENGDEQDTGMPESWCPSRNSSWEAGSDFVLEDDEDSDDPEDGADDEPSLGWNAYGETGQTFDIDLELDDSDREPNGDETDHSPLSEEVGFTFGGYDGSGADIANELVKGLPTFWDRPMEKALIALGVDPDRSEIDRMRRS
jgi:hypothetical protein